MLNRRREFQINPSKVYIDGEWTNASGGLTVTITNGTIATEHNQGYGTNGSIILKPINANKFISIPPRATLTLVHPINSGEMGGPSQDYIGFGTESATNLETCLIRCKSQYNKANLSYTNNTNKTINITKIFIFRYHKATLNTSLELSLNNNIIYPIS